MEDQKYVNLLLVEGPTEDFVAVCPYKVSVCEGDAVQIGTGEAAVRGIVSEKFTAYENGTVIKMFQRIAGDLERVTAVYQKTWEDEAQNEDSDSH